jgi:Holliday junction resolvasome RuvABC DNA-binding subunit
VGRKTAERLVVDLRDKLDGAGESAGDKAGSPGVREGEDALVADVLSALINLGYPSREAEKALSDARRALQPPKHRGDRQPVVTFERLLRDALRSASAPH